METPLQLSSTTPPKNRSPNTARLYVEGVIAGTLATAAIGMWLVLLDVVQARPLFTPYVLGRALFFGAEKLAEPQNATISFDMVMGFLFVHWLNFVAIGCIAARLLGLAERRPNLAFGVILLFVVLEGAFLGASAVLAAPVLQVLAWPTVLVGNLLAALVMGVYFWRRHPHMTIYP